MEIQNLIFSYCHSSLFLHQRSQRLKTIPKLCSQSFPNHLHSRVALQGSDPRCSRLKSLRSIMSNDIKELHPLILQLANADQRESALLELCRKREAYPDLTPVLWQSCANVLLNPSPFSADPILVAELLVLILT